MAKVMKKFIREDIWGKFDFNSDNSEVDNLIKQLDVAVNESVKNVVCSLEVFISDSSMLMMSHEGLPGGAVEMSTLLEFISDGINNHTEYRGNTEDLKCSIDSLTFMKSVLLASVIKIENVTQKITKTLNERDLLGKEFKK